MTLNELFARFDKLAAVSHPPYCPRHPGPAPEPAGWLHVGRLRESAAAKDHEPQGRALCQHVPCWAEGLHVLWLRVLTLHAVGRVFILSLVTREQAREPST